MAAASAPVFISHLSGMAVFAQNGDQLGRVRDVVASLRTGDRPPKVLGLVVEVASRRRIFLPMTRVTSIDAKQIITTGLVNMRRFEQRATETLVIAEMLDRRVRYTADPQDGREGQDATVLDVAMAQTRLRDWEITKVFIGIGAARTGPLRRRGGETRTVPWSDVTGFSLAEEGQGAANLLAAVEQLRPADLANVMHHLSPKRRSEVAGALDDGRLADVLEELPEDDQISIIGGLQDERAADILEEMDPDDAADLLHELPDAEAERLLQLMEPDEAAPVRRLLSYPEYTAGGMMTPEPIVARPDDTVAEALARVRNADLSPALASQVYVCRAPSETPTGRYLGLVHFQKLLREPPFTLLGGIVDDDLQPLPPDTPLRQVTTHMAVYNIVAVPVVDEADHLLGAVTADDVLDHLLPDDWREAVLDHGDPDGPGGPRDLADLTPGQVRASGATRVAKGEA
ncbi:magnesium transporter MgtE N-terminal domain-containing protein [Mangrovactinospora gilvigrisea]|uniref:magnesium transporter MgtE N-terminal domain-containing protein n=1 Tax=Mangrovactinospora gilvigrisea TaxID=1428644 RepID=UPI0008FCCA02|nr:CBS domain-containing protein [Mangrovactinospora gilvigrisea]